MRILSVGRAFPPHAHDQAAIRAELERMWRDHPRVLARLPALHENVRVRARHTALPLERYAELSGFGEANDTWIRVAEELGARATLEALERAGLAPRDVDAIFSVTVTGVASPSLDARLVNRIELRRDVKRTPIFGLGCVAGVAGLARAADYLRAFPDQVAVLLSVELCSLTFQRDDLSVANLISAALFGDGAAAVVLAGAERARALEARGLQVEATRSVFYPGTEHVMGWQVSERGFRIVLSPEVPVIARERLRPDVDAFLAEHGLAHPEIASWVCHPGGPKVLAAMQAGLCLSDDQVAHSWRVLAEQGNLSSTSALMVLRELLEEGAPAAGAPGLCVAMGPGFCSELVLFRWA